MSEANQDAEWNRFIEEQDDLWKQLYNCVKALKGGANIYHVVNGLHSIAKSNQDAKTPQGMNSQEDLNELVRFLNGSQPLDGYWYSDTPTDRPKYWWRKKLSTALINYERAIEARELAAQERLLDELEAVIEPYGLEVLDDEIVTIPVHKVLGIMSAKRQQLNQKKTN